MRTPLLLVAALLAGCTAIPTSNEPQMEGPELPGPLREHVTAAVSMGQIGADADFEVPAGLEVLLVAEATWSTSTHDVAMRLTSGDRLVARGEPTKGSSRIDLQVPLGPGSYNLAVAASGVVTDERIDLRGTFRDLSEDAQPRMTAREPELDNHAAVIAGAALLPFLAWLFSRIRSRDLLSNDRRRAIMDLVSAEPGLRITEIAQRLDVPHQSVQHHLSVLSRAGMVHVHRQEGETTVAPSHIPPAFAAARSLLRRRAGQFARLLQHGEATGTYLAAQAGTAASTTHHHLNRLLRAGVVQRTPSGWCLTELGRQVLAFDASQPDL